MGSAGYDHDPTFGGKEGLKEMEQKRVTDMVDTEGRFNPVTGVMNTTGELKASVENEGRDWWKYLVAPSLYKQSNFLLAPKIKRKELDIFLAILSIDFDSCRVRV